MTTRISKLCVLVFLVTLSARVPATEPEFAPLTRDTLNGAWEAYWVGEGNPHEPYYFRLRVSGDGASSLVGVEASLGFEARVNFAFNVNHTVVRNGSVRFDGATSDGDFRVTFIGAGKWSNGVGFIRGQFTIVDRDGFRILRGSIILTHGIELSHALTLASDAADRYETRRIE